MSPESTGVEPAPGEHERARAAARQRKLVVQLVIAGLVLVGALFVFVFPISAWLDQRGQLSEAEHRLDVLREQNQRLAAQSAKLHSNEEIERLARDRYGMVRPGEQAWAIVPGATTTTTSTTTPPAPVTR